MDFKLDSWLTREKIRISLKSEKTKSKLSYIKASILALLFGITLGIIIIFANGYNGIGYFFELFKVSFSTWKVGSGQSDLDRMMNHFSSYIILALGLAMAFKLGLFNIGGSGQAVLGAGLSIILVAEMEQSTGISFETVGGTYILVIFIIFVFSAALTSALAGVLKVFFNIHEVVTTVMMNWTIWYFVRWILTTSPKFMNMNQETKAFNHQWLTIGGNQWILGIILATICVGVVFFALSFTTFGYKYNVVGKQQDAAKYAGINNKSFVIIATAISGALIGIAAFIYYISIEKKLSYAQNDIPTFGFDGISIALVAFNNIFGIIPISFLWAVIKSSATAATGNSDFNGLSNEAASLMFGAVIYGAAIYSVFYRFVPIQKLKFKLYQNIDFKTRIEIDKNIAIINDYKNQISLIKLEKREAIKNYKKNPDIEIQSKASKNDFLGWKEILCLPYNDKISILKGKINSSKILNKILWDEGYKTYLQNGLKGVKNWKVKNDNLILGTTLDELTEYVIERDHKISQSKKDFKKFLKVSEKMNDSKLDDAILKQNAKQKFGIEDAEKDLADQTKLINTDYKDLLLTAKERRNEEIKSARQEASIAGEKSVIAYKKVIKVNNENYRALLDSVKKEYEIIESWEKQKLEEIKIKFDSKISESKDSSDEIKILKSQYKDSVIKIKAESFNKKMEVKY
ncbi:ABC transporter permease [Spiroplasma alleghenense]|uniref:Ribose/galactose ABC transporter permease n=1 Tax=Spiroplasma alleghenense TaxID=216931 RepID=A0A345Z2D4_9MOLU|nr:ABC transporter permease [Spiroplasma alleghenense]AXK50763.1 ribose/galactose ABC transporter permease [Spiroplasma alleghenense]